MPNVPSPRNSRTDPTFGRGSGNSNPNYSSFHNQPGQTRGRALNARFRDLFQYAVDRGAIPDMSHSPNIAFLESVRDNDQVRLELRLSAAAYAAPYTDQRLGAKPYTPALPANYRLRHDLKTTASCLEAHRQLAEDTLSGKIAADAATYVSEKFILPRIPHLEISEVRAELEAFRALVQQAREQTELEARLTTSGDYEVTVVTPPPGTDPAP
jgi:hypothetical protein